MLTSGLRLLQQIHDTVNDIKGKNEIAFSKFILYMTEIRESHCPLTGNYCNMPIKQKPNSFFLIEPFDELKNQREKAINRALLLYYQKIGGTPTLLVGNLENSHHQGLYCDICSKIKSSQYCIADITGELYEIVTKKGNNDEKIFLRSNVAFELGLAYGLNKPTFLLSGKINGKRAVPSDLNFARYIDVQDNDFEKSFYEVLLQGAPLININSLPINDNEKELLREKIKLILNIKRNLPFINKKNYLINQIVWDNNQVIGIIQDSEYLFENMLFEIYIQKGILEIKIGLLKVDLINSFGCAQVSFYYLEECDNTYINKIYGCCSKNISYMPENYKLIPYISKYDEKYLELFEIEQLENMLLV
jgi:hypothetical protein